HPRSCPGPVDRVDGPGVRGTGLSRAWHVQPGDRSAAVPERGDGEGAHLATAGQARLRQPDTGRLAGPRRPPHTGWTAVDCTGTRGQGRLPRTRVAGPGVRPSQCCREHLGPHMRARPPRVSTLLGAAGLGDPGRTLVRTLRMGPGLLRTAGRRGVGGPLARPAPPSHRVPGDPLPDPPAPAAPA